MMTIITLNLLAEEQMAQEARARDPIKLFTAIGLAVLTVAVAWGGVLSALLMQRRTEMQGLEAQWKKVNTVGVGEGEFQATSAAAEEIMTLNRSRVLMAPQLALVKDLIPPSVQLSQLGFALSVEATEAGGGGGEEGAEYKHPGRPKRTERLVVRLEGMASSSRPELEVDRFLKLLRSDARFSALVEDIQLRSISRVSKENDKAGSTPTGANFVIECWYKEKAAK
jgi:hypothetical protein